MHHQAAQEFLQDLPRVKNDLPFSTDVLQTLFFQTQEGSRASLEEIGHTLTRDQGLSAKVLSMANSAFYGLQAQVTSIERAAAVLGLKEIRTMVMALGLKALTDKRPLPPGFDLAGYWRHQFQAGCIARRVGRGLGMPDPDILFTAGLLHDLGKLVTALYRPEHWAAITELVEAEDLSFAKAEDAYWGLDHGVVAALVLKSWDLPPTLVEPVNWHHAPHLAPEYAEAAALVGLADALAQRLDDPDAHHAGLADAPPEILGLDADTAKAQAEEAVEAEAVESFVGLVA